MISFFRLLYTNIILTILTAPAQGETMVLFPALTGQEKAPELKSFDDPGREIAKALSFFISSDFRVKTVVTGSQFAGKGQIASQCRNNEADYLFQSEFRFYGKTVFHGKLYHCHTDETKEFTRSYPAGGITTVLEDISRRYFSFFPKNRDVQTKTASRQILVFSHSWSFYRETAEMTKMFDEADRVKPGYMIIGADKNLYVPPGSRLSPSLARLKQSRKADIGQLTDALVRLGMIEDIDKYEIIIMSNIPSSSGHNERFLQSLYTLVNRAGKVTFLQGSWFNQESEVLYERAAGITGRQKHISHYQKAGTGDGFVQLILHNYRLYYTRSEVPLDTVDFSGLNHIAPSEIYRTGIQIRPENMTAIYSAARGEKILETGDIHSSSEKILYQMIQGHDRQENSYRALLKKDGKAFWLNIPGSVRLAKGEHIALKTTFSREANSALYNYNTEIHTGEIPLLLDAGFTEIGRMLDRSPEFTCIIQGKVLEVRQ